MSNNRELVERLAGFRTAIADLLPLLRELLAEVRQLRFDVDALRGEIEAARHMRRVRWHDLRHYPDSQAVEAGVPLNVVQAWMGHSTIAMTMKYSHLAPDGGARWIGLLEGPQRKPDANGAENVG